MERKLSDKKEKHTLKETNFYKGIAIIMMLFHHLFNDYAEYAGFVVYYRPFSAERLTYLALMCKIRVSVFVFLSGFRLTASYHKNGNGYEKSGKKGIIQLMKKYGAITVLATMTAGIYLVGAANASTFYLFSLLLGSACYDFDSPHCICETSSDFSCYAILGEAFRNFTAGEIDVLRLVVEGQSYKI